jgi:site-specific recombinase XerD
MEKKVRLFDLMEETKREFAVKGYSTQQKSETYSTFRQLIRYAYERGEMYYTPEITIQFLRDKWGYPALDGEKPKWKESTVKHKLKAVRMINWMHDYGALPKRGTPFRIPLPPYYVEITELYETWQQTKQNYARNTINAQNRTCLSFINFLLERKISDLNQVKGSHISDYAITLRGHAAATMKSDLGRLRIFLKFLYLQGITAKNMAEYVPSFHYGRITRESNIWSKEELNQLLSSIDRSSPTGKRDYAASLLAIDLGLRNADIVALNLDNIHWDLPPHIEFAQSKTRKALTLPLPERVGLAIIDYLKYGRPKTEHQNVFVRHIAPYEAMRSFSGVFCKRVSEAGIPRKINRKYGLHSLRHTVATRMLENGVEFNLIAPFLGHADENTLHVYLNSDIEHLRQCALSFEPEDETA